MIIWEGGVKPPNFGFFVMPAFAFFLCFLIFHSIFYINRLTVFIYTFWVADCVIHVLLPTYKVRLSNIQARMFNFWVLIAHLSAGKYMPLMWQWHLVVFMRFHTYLMFQFIKSLLSFYLCPCKFNWKRWQKQLTFL